MRARTVTALAIAGAFSLVGCSSNDTSTRSAPVPASGAATTSSASSAATLPATDDPGDPQTTGSTHTPAPAVTEVHTTLEPPVTDAPPSTVGPTSSTPPDPAQLTFTAIGKVKNPVDMAYRPGDSAFYIVSQDGFVVAMRAGVVDGTKLLDISRDIVSGGEQGLLGLAFSNDGGHAYVDYTNRKGDTEITEFAVGADGVFDAASKRLLLKIDQPYPNHNGGQVRIGPDGYLYIGMGDGGAAGDPKRNGLNTSALLGKILRIDPTPNGDEPYTIPADNPFVDTGNSKPEIWAVGVRNPWRYSFDLATGDLWIADVGQDNWEEIDVAWADQGGGRAANFGWSAFEGTHQYNKDQPTDGVIPPIHEYAHGPKGCSVSGGVRYRGTAIPAMYGWYVYGDYCSGQIRAFPVLDDRTAGDEVTLSASIPSISEVAQGPDGEIYVLSVDQGTILALRPAG